MEVKAKARYVRMSPRKVRLVIDVVRGMTVDEALTQLKFIKKDAAMPVYKVIASAAANAQHNFKLNKADLIIKEITADGGPVLHRWRPRAFGRAGAIRKRTTHINVVLDTVKTDLKDNEKKVEKKQNKKVVKNKITGKVVEKKKTDKKQEK
ncbi:MAG: 50S ribosomal protein L22 [Patescibacteria group bacterium]